MSSRDRDGTFRGRDNPPQYRRRSEQSQSQTETSYTWEPTRSEPSIPPPPPPCPSPPAQETNERIPYPTYHIQDPDLHLSLTKLTSLPPSIAHCYVSWASLIHTISKQAEPTRLSLLRRLHEKSQPVTLHGAHQHLPTFAFQRDPSQITSLARQHHIHTTNPRLYITLEARCAHLRALQHALDPDTETPSATARYSRELRILRAAQARVHEQIDFARARMRCIEQRRDHTHTHTRADPDPDTSSARLAHADTVDWYTLHRAADAHSATQSKIEDAMDVLVQLVAHLGDGANDDDDASCDVRVSRRHVDAVLAHTAGYMLVSGGARDAGAADAVG